MSGNSFVSTPVTNKPTGGFQIRKRVTKLSANVHESSPQTTQQQVNNQLAPQPTAEATTTTTSTTPPTTPPTTTTTSPTAPQLSIFGKSLDSPNPFSQTSLLNNSAPAKTTTPITTTTTSTTTTTAAKTTPTKNEPKKRGRPKGKKDNSKPAPTPSNNAKPAPAPAQSNNAKPAATPSNNAKPAPAPSNNAKPAPAQSNNAKPTPKTKNTNESDKSKPANTQKDVKELECGICFDPVDTPAILVPCSHTFCFECISKWTSSAKFCPICSKWYDQVKKKDTNGNYTTYNVNNRSLVPNNGTGPSNNNISAQLHDIKNRNLQPQLIDLMRNMLALSALSDDSDDSDACCECGHHHNYNDTDSDDDYHYDDSDDSSDEESDSSDENNIEGDDPVVDDDSSDDDNINALKNEIFDSFRELHRLTNKKGDDEESDDDDDDDGEAFSHEDFVGAFLTYHLEQSFKNNNTKK